MIWLSIQLIAATFHSTEMKWADISFKFIWVWERAYIYILDGKGGDKDFWKIGYIRGRSKHFL